jgi:hypothetical protein
MARLERISGTDIDTMLLVGVAVEHGVAGLRQRLATTLDRIGLADNELIQTALTLAMDLHSGDKRTYEPFNAHLLRSALRLIEDLGITDPAIIAAALLHDSVEDHPEELIRGFLDKPIPVDRQKRQALAGVALRQFSSLPGAADTAGIVWDVTTPVRPMNEPKIEWYAAHSVKLVLKGDPRSSAEKTADFMDNIDTPLDIEDPNKRAHLDEKQIGVYVVHIAGIQRPDSIIPPEFREGALDLLEQKEAEARARLHARGVPDIALVANSLRTA